jgi:diphosphomevalonate decarboxylase
VEEGERHWLRRDGRGPRVTTARACANIALVKYWGKRDSGTLNLPATGSLSVSLAALVTETTVTFERGLAQDEVGLDTPAARARVVHFLDLVRARAGISLRARVETKNRFPTASGLASSASGFAALAVAATRAAGVDLTPRELSILARRGSGSAARSIFGGFVRMHAGAHEDGTDAYAEQIDTLLARRMRVVIAIVGAGAPKQHASRDAMEHVAETSPLYRDWIALVPADLAAAEAAIAGGDLPALGMLAEANALAMHATAIAARPAIIYWQPATIALLAAVRALRAAGRAAWATIDAGPHVKVLTTAEDATEVARSLTAVEGVSSTMVSEIGGAAEVVV